MSVGLVDILNKKTRRKVAREFSFNSGNYKLYISSGCIADDEVDAESDKGEVDASLGEMREELSEFFNSQDQKQRQNSPKITFFPGEVEHEFVYPKNETCHFNDYDIEDV